MREIVRTKQFKKDYKKVSRTGRNLERLIEAVSLLGRGAELPGIYRDHQLIGNWQDHRECHLGGDLLMIYRMTGNELRLVRMGSHTELFD